MIAWMARPRKPFGSQYHSGPKNRIISQYSDPRVGLYERVKLLFNLKNNAMTRDEFADQMYSGIHLL